MKYFNIRICSGDWGVDEVYSVNEIERKSIESLGFYDEIKEITKEKYNPRDYEHFKESFGCFPCFKSIQEIISAKGIIKECENKIVIYEILKHDENFKIKYGFRDEIQLTIKEKDEIIKILIDSQQNIIDKKLKELE